MFAYHTAAVVRELSKDVNVICLISCGGSGIYYHIGPAGGFGLHTRGIVEDEMGRSGRSYEDVVTEVGRISRSPRKDLISRSRSVSL